VVVCPRIGDVAKTKAEIDQELGQSGSSRWLEHATATDRQI